MNIEHGREFIELAQCLNFTEAAGTLNITQPALSKHILALEREFGTELLDRSRRGVQLTEAGRILFENASIIVEAYDQTKQRIDQLKRMRPIHVVGHMDDSDVATLASMTAMMAREGNHATVVFDRTEADPFDLLSERAIDLFIGYASEKRIQEAGFSSVPFVSTQLLAIVSTSHPLAGQDSVTWDDLRNQTLVKFMSDRTNPAWEQIELACEAHGFKPNVRPVSGQSNVEFFSTPLRNDVLIWKATEKQIGLLLETGRRAGIPLTGEGSRLTSVAVYRPGEEDHLHGFFAATEEARALLDQHRRR